MQQTVRTETGTKAPLRGIGSGQRDHERDLPDSATARHRRPCPHNGVEVAGVHPGTKSNGLVIAKVPVIRLRDGQHFSPDAASSPDSLT
jgi:hypothetical protein